MTDYMPLQDARISNVESTGSFDFRWPNGPEHFESGWSYQLSNRGEIHEVRHGIGSREVYGRQRVHTVTWLDGDVQVEGVETDDYPSTGALVSLLRHSDKRTIRTIEEVPADYVGFKVVEHRREVEAKGSRYCFAVKLDEDDLLGWGVHALIRSRQRGTASPRATRNPTMVLPVLPAAPTLVKRAVAAGILEHGEALARALGGGTARFTADDDANTLIHADPFAFLVAVIADQGVRAERAWKVPSQLQLRLASIIRESSPRACRPMFLND